MNQLAHKQELRDEIKALRFVGSQMANLCFNLGQNANAGDLGRMVTGDQLVSMHDLSKQWDAVKRAER